MDEQVTTAYLDRLEEGKAVLLVGDDEEQMEEIVLPAALLPKSLREGEYARIAIARDLRTTEALAAEARALLDD